MSRPQTLAAVQLWLRRALKEAGVADAATDARVLILGLLDLSPTVLLTQDERPVSDAEFLAIAAGLERRRAHEPVHRILGHREFYGLSLALSPDTLEPRPDTETLVDCMLPHVRAVIARKGQARVLDLGTGTGAILLALLAEAPEASGVGVDAAEGALATAIINADKNRLRDRFEPVKSDWFSAVSGRFDIIVSNPPYIKSEVVSALDRDVRDYDPALALDGGIDGLDAYRQIAAGALQYLETGGIVGVEIGYDQRLEVSALFEAEGFQTIEAVRDYGGNDRVLVFAANSR